MDWHLSLFSPLSCPKTVFLLLCIFPSIRPFSVSLSWNMTYTQIVFRRRIAFSKQHMTPILSRTRSFDSAGFRMYISQVRNSETKLWIS